jgi:hypothetical protein
VYPTCTACKQGTVRYGPAGSVVLGRAAGIVMDNTGRSEGNTGSSGSRYKVQRLQRAQKVSAIQSKEETEVTEFVEKLYSVADKILDGSSGEP